MGFALFAVVLIPFAVMHDRLRPSDGFYRETLFRAKHPAWEFLLAESDSVREPIRVAYAGINCGYVFMGREYKDQSVYVPVNDLGYMPHEFKQGSYRDQMDVHVWIDNLSELGIDYLICQPVDTKIPEDRWAARNTGRFKKVFEDKYSRVYRFIDPMPAREYGREHKQLQHPESMIVRTPEPGQGGDFFADVVWSIDSDRTMEFDYAIDSEILSTARYPSPAFSPRCIHRIRAPVPASLTPGNHAFTVGIQSDSDDHVETIHLSEIHLIAPGEVPALPAPARLSPEDGARLEPNSRFTWDAVPGAIGYRLRVTLPDGTQADRFLEETNLDSYWDAEANRRLPAGTYSWRVSAVDAHGYPGIPSVDIVFRVDSSR